jgi:hypothetical protein
LTERRDGLSGYDILTKFLETANEATVVVATQIIVSCISAVIIYPADAVVVVLGVASNV